MAEKPTYEELEIRIGDLEKDITGRKRMEAALQESEELYRTVVESTTDAIVVLDLDRRIVSCNQGFCRLFGYSVDEVKGKSVRIIHRSEEAFREFGGAAYERMETTGSYRGEWYFRKKEGVLFPAETVTSAMRKDGSVAGYVGFIRDITERKLAEEELRNAHERLEILLYALPLGIVVIDEETHRIIDANPKASLMIGAPVDKILRRSCHEFICPYEEGKCPVTDLGKDIESSERILLTFDGREVPILKTVLPVEMEDGKCLIECFSDISEIKSAESERSEKEKLQAVVETAGAVCHEMNQPLMAISGYSELLQMNVTESEKVFQFAQKIRAQVERMAGITRKLMRITSHRTKKYLDTKILDIDGASEKLE
jgi:PAS domain S-box-containing protein